MVYDEPDGGRFWPIDIWMGNYSLFAGGISFDYCCGATISLSVPLGAALIKPLKSLRRNDHKN